jgi:hypothetical protein
MAVNLPYSTLTTSPATKAQVESNFTALANKFGSIVNADIDSSAAIDLSKLAASYEYITVPLVHETVGTGGLITANRVLAGTPLYNDGKGAWTAVAYSWYCKDVGAQTGSINLLWGYYETTGSLNASPTTIVSNELLNGGTANTPFNDGAAISISLPWTVNRMLLYMTVNTADATAINTDGDQLTATVTLKRQIAS